MVGFAALNPYAMRSSRRGSLALDFEALIQISPDCLHQRLDPAVEEMISAGNNLLLDHDALLRFELLDEAADILVGYYAIAVAVNNKPGGRAGREKREVVQIGRGRDGNESLDFRPAHK